MSNILNNQINKINTKETKLSENHFNNLLIDLLTNKQENQKELLNKNNFSKTNSIIDKKILEDEEYQQYINHLMTSSIEELKNEPQLIENHSKYIDQQLASVTFNNYKYFLDANLCSQGINKSLSSVSEKNDSMLNILGNVENACKDFTKSLDQFVDDKNRIKLILNHHSKIVEILEIPQLLDTFIRNGYYDEAMELKNHSKKILSSHTDSNLLQKILKEVEETSALMITQLIQLLRCNIKLSLCIRIINYLRKMDLFKPHELPIIFLQQRDIYLKTLISEIKVKDYSPDEYLRKYIDILREHFIEIINQYIEIFINNSNIFVNTNEIANNNTNKSEESDNEFSYSLILSSYITTNINDIVEVFKLKLPLIKDIAKLSSLSVQVMYFGMSLGKNGIDFRHIIEKLFEENVENIIIDQIQIGTEKCITWFKECEIQNMYGKNSDSQMKYMQETNKNENNNNNNNLNESNNTDSSTSLIDNSSLPIFKPQEILLSYPNLALIINLYFNIYNTLRIFAPISCLRNFLDCIIKNLKLYVDAVDQYGQKEEHKIWTLRERQIYEEICKIIVIILVPSIINGFLKGVYGGVKHNIDSNQIIEHIVAPIKENINKVSYIRSPENKESIINEENKIKSSEEIKEIESRIDNIEIK
ncbi:Dor1-domain-containing protein [Piromyces finnis]|uniref:Conserved oligomeric Golgi complex subunit 8 n=1 Tax=Piromyces finnis TaxID=1754191 RepID=A0A1Y1VMM6_9FUNG|nr:Dor1-domain-containing protein [Piromyces finnis]|eukprot:ORX60173.1 Dor1-domain-containing protein [Piromyces finnis]